MDNETAIDLGFNPDTCAGPVYYGKIDHTERSYEFHFDPLYLRLLEHCNGGVPRKRFFPVPGNVKVVERFLCVIANVRDNERHGRNDMGVVITQVEGRMDGLMVPFASLFAGDLLCFDFGESDPPKVVVWDHERSGADSPVTVPVADGFPAFLSLLYADAE